MSGSPGALALNVGGHTGDTDGYGEGVTSRTGFGPGDTLAAVRFQSLKESIAGRKMAKGRKLMPQNGTAHGSKSGPSIVDLEGRSALVKNMIGHEEPLNDLLGPYGAFRSPKTGAWGELMSVGGIG